MMAKFRRMLAAVMVLCMCLSAMPLQALAADGTTTKHEFKDEFKNGSNWRTHIRTETTVTNSNGNPTVNVEIKDSNSQTGTAGAIGTHVEREEHSEKTTLTHKDENGNVVKEEVIHSKEETSTTTTTVTENSTQIETVEDGKEMTKEHATLPEGGVTVKVPTTKGESNSETFTGAAGTETVTGDEPEGEDDTEYDYTKTTVEEQGKVTVNNQEVTVKQEEYLVEDENGELKDPTNLEHIKSETNPDDTNDLVHYGQAPEAFLPGYEGEVVKPEIPEGYEYVYVGSGNTSKLVPAIVFSEPLSDEDKVAQYGDDPRNGAYIYYGENGKDADGVTYYTSSYIKWLDDELEKTVAYREDGKTPVTDEKGYVLDINGNRILKAEKTAKDPDGNIVYLHRFDNTGDGHKVEGWYDSETGEWVEELNGDNQYTAVWAGPQQFILVDGEGNIVTTYCADAATPTQDYYAYTMQNLEDATYYDDEQAEHIRAIAENGYWGTASGKGSLEAMKETLLASGQFTEEELASLNDGVALTATQMAIWSQSNKMSGIEFVNAHYSNWGTGNVPTDKEDEVELLFKVYDYLINLEAKKTEMTTADTLINDKNFVKDMSVTVIEMDKAHENNKDYDRTNDAYVTKVSFSLVVSPAEDNGDNLMAYLMDGDGKVVASGRVAGNGTEGDYLPKDEAGNYYFDNVTMVEGDQQFQLNLSGIQNLQQGVYLYTSEIKNDEGEEVSSQTMVGVASGERGVNVTMDIKFDVAVEGLQITERVWHREHDPIEEEYPDDDDDTPPTPPQNPGDPGEPATVEEPVTTVYTVTVQEGDAIVIEDEEVPLAAAPETGDNSFFFIAVILMAAMALYVVNFGKKNEYETF